MKVEEFKGMMESSDNERTEKSTLEEKREKVMKDYLDDVVPISEYINKGFKEIDEKRLTKSDENK